MGKLEDIQKAESFLNNAQYDVLSIGVRLTAIDREIAVYKLYEFQLIENINILKRNKIIALAQEYKKAKEELATVRRKLTIACFDHTTHLNALENAQKRLKDGQAHYDILLNKYDNNVVKGPFRRNSSGQG